MEESQELAREYRPDSGMVAVIAYINFQPPIDTRGVDITRATTMPNSATLLDAIEWARKAAKEEFGERYVTIAGIEIHTTI